MKRTRLRLLCSRFLRSWCLWPRGRLDITGRDLFYAARALWLPGEAPQRVWPNAGPQLVTLCVRTAWDALLSVQAWPLGSEVLFSEANITDMVRLIEAHGLVPIAVPLNPDTLAVEVREVEARITPRTRALLVSPLFGSRMALAKLGALARERGLLLVEDNAQAYCDVSYRGSPEADVSLFSFGLIKTRTALGGAVVFARDGQLLQAMAQHVATYPRVSTCEFAQRWMRAVLLHALSGPLCYGVFWRALQWCGIAPDVWLSQFTRGVNGPLFVALRRQPHRATCKLLRRRLRIESKNALAWRVRRGQESQRVLSTALGRDNTASTFWALPVRVSHREALVSRAREAGFDVSRASSVVCHGDTPTRFSQALESVVYLPVGTPMPQSEWNRLLQLVSEWALAEE